MFTPLDERAKALDRQLVELGDAMVKQYGLGQEIPLEGVGVPRQEVICCIGRICNAAHEGRINATSVLLEGSRQVSGGARIELDLTALQNESKPFSLFPGQIVAVEGMNTSGRKLVAHKIYEGVANPVTKTPSKTLLRYYHDDAFQGGQPLRIMTVCGPYTSSDNLDYEPFLDLVNVINAERPDVAILTGPFVDTRHEAIRTGQTILKDVDNGTDIVVPYETLFAQKVAALLEDLFQEDEHFSTQFVLVPSLNDATAEWVIPQPPLKNNAATISDIQGSEGIEIGSLGLHHIENVNRTDQKMHRVHCVSNPCTLQINELVIGVSCTDTLFDISTDETNANLEPGSRLGRISQHMIHQQNYYPLFPPSMGVNLDWKKRSQWKMPCQPDVLIVPSKLACFAKTILSHTVVVNPGHLTRETTGGTYALMEVHPMLRDIVEDSGSSEVQLQHGAPSRTKVEIKRI
jgi:DNA polymerase alpha subunit B